jgi:hypothetical protein
MKYKFAAYAFLTAVLGLGLLGVNAASAHGMFGPMNNLSVEDVAAQQQNMFQDQATLLGVTVDEVKNAWAEGKSLQTLAQEKGITQDQLQQRMKDAQLAKTKTMLQGLVTKGIITQTQADKRLTSIQNMAAQKGAKGRRMMNRGMML